MEAIKMKGSKFNKIKNLKYKDFENLEINRKKKANKPTRKKETEH